MRQHQTESSAAPLADKRRKCRLPLGTKFILLIASVLSLALATEALVNYHNQRTLLLQSLKEKAAVQGKFVASISKEAILSRDYVSLNRYMQDISRIEDVVYGVITSTKGDFLTTYLDQDKPHVKRLLNNTNHSDLQSTIKRIDSNPEILALTYPVMLEKEHIANMTIAVDQTRAINLARRELMLQLSFNAAIIVGLGLAIYVIFRYSALRPIRSLTEGAARVSAGNLNEPVPIQSADELGELTGSFNQMMARLKESLAQSQNTMGEMRELNRNLEARVQERTARLELAQRIAQMGHWDFEVDEGTFHASHQVYTLLGLSEKNVLGRHALLRAIHPDDRRGIYDTFTLAVAKARAFEAEFRIILPTGVERILIITAEITISEQSGKSRLFGILQDITERASAEYAAQKALNEKLDAESANEAKSAFLANMSHEIRTPLTAIIGFAETMQDLDQPIQERVEATETIIKNGRHLLQVINEILDLSKIESRRLELEILPTPVLDVVADVEALIIMSAHGKQLSLNVEYDYPIPRYIETDPTRFKQILLNLCSNAIKFTSTGGVRIRIGFEAEKQLLRIAVMDTGIGIRQDKIYRLFTPFTQADSSTTRRFGGTGLGLYISKQLAEMLGGTVEIRSIEGMGTRVDITLATGVAASDDLITCNEDAYATADSGQNKTEAKSLRGHILLAEDSIDNQRLVSLFVKKLGATITIANNGKSALEKALAGEFDLVLMDMQMPIMDGIEATRLLRQSGYGGPIVALTANAFKEDREHCASAGCNDFLTKPIDRAAFHRVLQQYLPATDSVLSSTENSEKSALQVNLDDELRELAAEFIENLPDRVNHIQAAHAAGNLQELSSLLHQLKGIGSIFGYPVVTDQAGGIEQQIKHDDLAALEQRLGQLYQACDQAITHFNSHSRKTEQVS